MASYFSFGSTADLMYALGVCWKPDLFPEFVTVLANGRLALPTEGFRQLETVVASPPLGVVKENGTPAGRKELTANLLVGGRWIYRDPLAWNGDGSHRDDPRRGETRYDPLAAAAEYLLGARDFDEAQRLLDGLMAHMSDGVEVVPLVVEPNQDLAYLWLVSGHRPPLDLLRSAPRAWWGPAGHPRNACIFLQWPLSLAVSPSLLQRIAWRAGQGFVLLSREDPRCRVVAVAPERLGSLPIERVAAFPPVTSERLEAGDLPANTEFRVDLAVRRRVAAERITHRMARLHGEIHSRQVAVDKLAAELRHLGEEEQIAPLSFPEPLLLFYGDGEEVPADLRRLLIEWSNQPGDLDALRCARFTAPGFPAGGFRTAHIVTTLHALSAKEALPRDRTLPSRLMNYAPSLGALPCFEQLAQWAPFDLRLFTPRDSDLYLHPRLPASEVAAEKLANALHGHPVSRAERGRTLILLTPGDRDRVVVRHIPVDGFQPLAQAFDWQCAVNVTVTDLVAAMVAPPARADFVAGLGRNLEEALTAAEQAALTEKKEALQGRLSKDAAVLADYERRLEVKAGDVAAAAALWSAVSASVANLAAELGRIEHHLTSATRSLPSLTSLSSAIATVEAINHQLVQQRNALARLRREIQDLRRGGPRGDDQGSGPQTGPGGGGRR